jgi:predicted RNase H-like HicB family nuclease
MKWPASFETEQHMNGYAHRVILTADPDDGGFLVRVPVFPAIITQGDDVANALAMAKDAIELELVVAREASLLPPPPDAETTRVETVVVTPAAKVFRSG